MSERPQPWRYLGKKREMVVRFRRLFERDPHQHAKAGKCLWKYRHAFDDAGIAVGSALADAMLVDQRNRKPALGEM